MRLGELVVERRLGFVPCPPWQLRVAQHLLWLVSSRAVAPYAMDQRCFVISLCYQLLSLSLELFSLTVLFTPRFTLFVIESSSVQLEPTITIRSQVSRGRTVSQDPKYPSVHRLVLHRGRQCGRLGLVKIFDGVPAHVLPGSFAWTGAWYP